MKASHAGAVYVAANLITAAVPFLLLPLLTRVITPEEYGTIINFALAVSACSAFAGLSVHGAVGVAWFKHDRADLPRFIGSAIMLALISMTAIAMTLLVLLPLPGLSIGITPAWAAIAALTAGSNVLLQCRLVLWQSQSKPIPMGLMQILASILNAGLSLVAVLLLGLGGPGRNAGIAVAAGLMATVGICHLTQTSSAKLGLRWQDAKILLSFGVPLIPHALAGMLLASADRFVVSTQLGTQALGVYGAGAQLGIVMALLGDAFVKAFNPWLYSKFASKDPKDASLAVGAMIASVPAFLLLAAVMSVALVLASSVLLGPAYRAAVNVIPWFTLGGAFSGMYLAVSGLYFFSNRTALLSAITLPTAALGIVISLTLVTHFDVVGGAAGYAATQGLLALSAWIVACRSFPLPWNRPAEALGNWWNGSFRRRVSPS